VLKYLILNVIYNTDESNVNSRTVLSHVFHTQGIINAMQLVLPASEIPDLMGSAEDGASMKGQWLATCTIEILRR